MLLQIMEVEQESNKQHVDGGNVLVETALVQIVRADYKGYTKKEVLKAKEARRAQAMIGNLRYGARHCG